MDKQTAIGLSARDLLAQLSSSEQGLTAAEVASGRSRYGRNALTSKSVTALSVLVRQFQSTMIYFLIVAAVLSFVTGDLSDGTIITIILLINAGLGFSQEFRSERAVEALAHLISNRVSVRRDGAAVEVEATELVPGDVVLLKEGDIGPADLKLLSAEDIEVDESQLTGESIAIAKNVSAESEAGGANSLLFAGSTVNKGKATAVVFAIANETELGRIAALSTGITRVTQYEKSLQAFSTLLMKIIGVSLAFILVIKVATVGAGSNLSELVIFIIALAVAVIPEALPVISTLTLARGALRLAKERVVVKRLSSLEDLGNITLLCTDKTGTLTENKLTIQHLATTDDRLFQVLAYASIDQAALSKQGTQNSFDAAFDAYIPDDIKGEASKFTIVRDVPFDPAARRRRIILTQANTKKGYLVVIGSPETLFEIATCDIADKLRAQMVEEGKQGLRHLALAYRELTTAGEVSATDVITQEKGLVFLGFATMVDPLRASTPQTIKTAKQLGVGIKVLTGDSPEVAAYVAQEVGLMPQGGRVYSGADLAAMPATELARAVQESNVFARVSPEQKYAIVQALKEHEVVGYQGDGINDAPALKLADVGIAVDSATEVAKANADIILLDSDLGVVINGIKYGRTTFANINKYIKYTMVGNFGSFFALASLYLIAANLPLLPRQVLLASLLTDVPLVAISTDTVEDSELLKPNRYSAGALLAISVVLGSLTAIFELAFFATLHGKAMMVSQTSLYMFLSFTQLIVIVSIRNRSHFWRAARPSSLLVGAVAVTGICALLIPYLPPVARLFSFSAPSLLEVAVVLVMSLVYVLVLDFIKVWFYEFSTTDPGASDSAPTGGHHVTASTAP